MKTIRILLSSPGDVVEERQKARQIIDHLQTFYGSRVRLVPVLWEELPLEADTPFQAGIDLVLSADRGIDIAVFILWSRLGSPVSHPLRPDGDAYRSGTEREFDMMLAARQRSGEKRPHLIAYLRDDDSGFRRALTTAPADRLHEMINQHTLVQTFIHERFQDSSGRNLRAYHTYDQPLAFANRLKVHLRVLIDEILGEEQSYAVWDQSPYRGLQVFDVQHAPIFFGREQEVCDIELLFQRRAAIGKTFVVIVGASGSGKSSLARAGVAASLLHANIDETVKQWRLATMHPGGQDGNLSAVLTAALGDAEAIKELGDGGPDALVRFAKVLSTAPEAAVALTFADAMHRATESAGGTVRVLLIVDQLEELWSDRLIQPEAREQFLRTLALLATSGHVWILATLRADFYPVAMQSNGFAHLKRGSEQGRDCDGVFDLITPDPAAVHRLITEPAMLAGLRFERDEKTAHSLDQDLLRDAIGSPDALPLVEYALQLLFENRSPDGLLTFAAYAKIGGLEKALGLQAESVFAALPEVVQGMFPRVIGALIAASSDDARGQVVRRTTVLSAVADTEPKKAFVSAFVGARFFTTDREDEVPVVRIAHESLLRRWERLTGWIVQNRENLRLLLRVDHACARWIESGRDASLLLPQGLPLEEARKLQQQAPELLADTAAEFVAISIRTDMEQARAAVRKRRIRVGALATVAALAISAAGWALLRESDQRNLLNEYSENDRAIGFSLAQQGKWREALAYYARSLTSNPRNILAAQDTFLMILYGQGPRWRIPLRIESADASTRAAPYSMRFEGTNLLIEAAGSKRNLWPPSTSEIRHPTHCVRSVDFALTAVNDGVRSEIYNPLATNPALTQVAGAVTQLAVCRSNYIAVIRVDCAASETSANETDTPRSASWRIVNLSRGFLIDIEQSPPFFRTAPLAVGRTIQPSDLHPFEENESPSVFLISGSLVAGIAVSNHIAFVDLAAGAAVAEFNLEPSKQITFLHIADDGSSATLQYQDGALCFFDLTTRSAPKVYARASEQCLNVLRVNDNKAFLITRSGSVLEADLLSTNKPQLVFAEEVGYAFDPSLDQARRRITFGCQALGDSVRSTWDLDPADAFLAGEDCAFGSPWETASSPHVSDEKAPTLRGIPLGGGGVESQNIVGYYSDPRTGETVSGELQFSFKDPEGRFCMIANPGKLCLWNAKLNKPIGQELSVQSDENSLMFLKPVHGDSTSENRHASSGGEITSTAYGRTRIKCNDGCLLLQLPPSDAPRGKWLATLAMAASGLRLTMEGQMSEISIAECYRIREELRLTSVPETTWAEFLDWWLRIGSTRGRVQLKVIAERQ